MDVVARNGKRGLRMASSYFKTELGVLDRLTNMLTDSEECMDSALRAMKDESSGRIGTPELDQACADFQKTWAYGLEQMKKSSTDLRDGLKNTSANYRQVENALQNELKKLNATIPGQSTGSGSGSGS